jgi:hypothetical protein
MFRVGEQVEGNWDDGYWYVAKIGTIEGNKYRLVDGI